MSIFKPVVVLSVCAVLFGCSSDQLPVNTRILIAPESKTFTINTEFEEGMFCFKEGSMYQDVPLLISVTDDQNAPVGGAEVGVYADYTANTFNSIDMLELYSDKNGNGVVDGPEELVTSATSGVYKAKTDKYHGTTMLMLRVYMSCPYEGEVFAFVGSSTYSMSVGVKYGSGSSDGGDTDGGDTDAGGTDSGGSDSGGTDSGTTDAGAGDSGGTESSDIATADKQLDGGSAGE